MTTIQVKRRTVAANAGWTLQVGGKSALAAVRWLSPGALLRNYPMHEQTRFINRGLRCIRHDDTEGEDRCRF
ncbi:MAG: hypothetical protein AAGF92_07695 [Myxococcota bacterium]